MENTRGSFTEVVLFLSWAGIGGFMVRQRSRTGQGKAKRGVVRKDSSGSVPEQLPSRDDGMSHFHLLLESAGLGDDPPGILLGLLEKAFAYLQIWVLRIMKKCDEALTEIQQVL